MAAIVALSLVNTRARPVRRYTPSAPIIERSMAVLLTIAPSGARFPFTYVTVLVSPLLLACSGLMMTSSGSTRSSATSRSRSARRRSEASHKSSARSNGSPKAVSALPSSNPSRRRCNITSGTPPARNTRRVVWGPLGKASTNRGTCRLTRIQSSIDGCSSPAACATAGRCNRRFVDPPKAE